MNANLDEEEELSNAIDAAVEDEELIFYEPAPEEDDE